MTTFIDAGGVADLLGLKRDQFLRRRDDLEGDHRFPLPMPHFSRPLKWRRDQVEAWIDDHGRPKDADADAAPASADGKVVRLMERARA